MLPMPLDNTSHVAKSPPMPSIVARDGGPRKHFLKRARGASLPPSCKERRIEFQSKLAKEGAVERRLQLCMDELAARDDDMRKTQQQMAVEQETARKHVINLCAASAKKMLAAQKKKAATWGMQDQSARDRQLVAAALPGAEVGGLTQAVQRLKETAIAATLDRMRKAAAELQLGSELVQQLMERAGSKTARFCGEPMAPHEAMLKGRELVAPYIKDAATLRELQKGVDAAKAFSEYIRKPSAPRASAEYYTQLASKCGVDLRDDPLPTDQSIWRSICRGNVAVSVKAVGRETYNQLHEAALAVYAKKRAPPAPPVPSALAALAVAAALADRAHPVATRKMPAHA